MEIRRAKTLIEGLPSTQTVLLVGPPGVGKTSLARQLAGDGVCKVVDLNAHLPEDLAGYPRPSGEYVERLPEQWMYELSEERLGDRGAVLVLDDIAQVGPSMQAAVFRVALERHAGAVQLGSGVRVICTANRRSDRAGATTLLSPLVSRCWTVQLDASHDDWQMWAVEEGIDPRVRGYLRFRQEHLSRLPSQAGELGRFASPRAWHFVSLALDERDPGVEQMFDLAAGFVGEGPAVEFAAFCRHYGSLPDPEEALHHPETVGPIEEPDRLIAILTAVVDTALEKKVDLEIMVKALGVISGDNAEMAASAFQHAMSSGRDEDDRFLVSIAKALARVPEIQPILSSIKTALGIPKMS